MNLFKFEVHSYNLQDFISSHLTSKKELQKIKDVY